MSWTKVIICDLCQKQHNFFQDVMRERDLIGTMLGWVYLRSGRARYDVCKECRGEASIDELKRFFAESPVSKENFQDTIVNCFQKGWNHNNPKYK